MTLGFARPSSIDEMAQVLRDACAAGTSLRIVAGKTWLDAGRPVQADATLDLSSLTGIVDYAPGDFTLTARAGTSLSEIDAVTRSHNQYLPLDPHGPRTGTLGATLATASTGPLSSSAGTPRDITLGITFVDGEGALIQGGGRVVKNVAGFDLVRLTIGAWGTLGAIAEATVRLRAIPPADLTLAMSMPAADGELVSRLGELSKADVVPLAAELLNPALASRTGAGEGNTLLIRIAGNSSGVRAQRDALHRVERVREMPAEIWRQLAGAEPASGRVLRLSTHPADFPRLWHEILTRVDAEKELVLGNVRRGVIRVCATGARETLLKDLVDRPPLQSTVIAERLSAAAWPAPSARLTHPLARSLRQTFDPRRILNPGILTPEFA